MAKKATSRETVLANHQKTRSNSPIVGKTQTPEKAKTALKRKLNAMFVEKKATFHRDVRNARPRANLNPRRVRVAEARARVRRVGRRVREKAAGGGKALSFRT